MESNIEQNVQKTQEGSDKIILLAEEFAKKNRILMAGYKKIGDLLLSKTNIQKEEINNIILETMDQIS